MPTSYTDQFWILDPFSPPPVGTILTPVSLVLVDENDDDDIESSDSDTIDGQFVTGSFPFDTVTVTLSNGDEITVAGTTFYLADGREVFTPTDGTILETATLVSAFASPNEGPLDVRNLGPACFADGTLIETPLGSRLVEDLQPGDLVTSHDGEHLTLRKVYHRRLTAPELARNDKLRPVRIRAGALGMSDGAPLPQRDLWVSRQHRMLVRSRIAIRMFDSAEVLVAAVRLTDLPGIDIDQSRSDLTYHHLVFDAHEIVRAEGAPTESLFTGPNALAALEPEARDELLSIFPQIADDSYQPVPARCIPTGARQKRLVARHLKNNRPLIDA